MKQVLRLSGTLALGALSLAPPPPHRLLWCPGLPLLAVPLAALDSGRPDLTAPVVCCGGGGEDAGDDGVFVPCLAELGDIEAISALFAECLGSSQIVLPTGAGALSDAELRVVAPLVAAWNGFASAATRTETKIGLRLRGGDRLWCLAPGGDSFEAFGTGIVGGGSAKTSAFRAVAVGVGDNAGSGTEATFGRRGQCALGPRGRQSALLVLVDAYTGRIAAGAELALEPLDGSLPSNFRGLLQLGRGDGFGAESGGYAFIGLGDGGWGGGSARGDDGGGGGLSAAGGFQPYLCNVAVAPGARRRGLGRRLVALAEHVARAHWGAAALHLHVDPADPAAGALYAAAGYRPVRGDEGGDVREGDGGGEEGSRGSGGGSGSVGGMLPDFARRVGALFIPEVTYMYKAL
jgi:ribosomal protein S18 acetylase RimI-like enzyme